MGLGRLAVRNARARRPRRLVPVRAAVMIGLLAAGCDDPAAPPGTEPVDPPFNGTIFIDPDIITSSDPTTFQGLSYAARPTGRCSIAAWTTG